jgi:rubrerythrin
MSQLLVCEACGEAFDHDPADFWADCPACDARYPTRAGYC